MLCSILCALVALLLLTLPELGQRILTSTLAAGKNFLLIIPPVFVCVGLLDVWVDRERMIKAMGDGSGISGVSIAFLFGVVTAIPIYALFPVAGILMKKGCRLENVLIFMCSSASIRIPLLLFETASLGWELAVTRLVCNILVVLGIAWFIGKVVPGTEKMEIYTMARRL